MQRQGKLLIVRPGNTTHVVALPTNISSRSSIYVAWIKLPSLLALETKEVKVIKELLPTSLRVSARKY